jgi:hypothetical protein
VGWPSFSRAGPPPKAVGVFLRLGRVSVDRVQRDPGTVYVVVVTVVVVVVNVVTVTVVVVVVFLMLLL